MNTQEGFDVIDEFEVQDLTEVKADQNLFPVASDLKVRIEKATTQMNKNKNIYALKCQFRVVDGIPGEDGQMTRVNAVLFNGLMDLVYGAKMDVDGRADNKWWKNNQHLVEFKNFCKALELPLAGLKVNDQLMADLIGRELLVSVAHEAETIADPSGELNEKTGKVKKVPTGNFNQKLRNWKKAA